MSSSASDITDSDSEYSLSTSESCSESEGSIKEEGDTDLENEIEDLYSEELEAANREYNIWKRNEGYKRYRQR